MSELNIQVNSDKTITVDASAVAAIESEVSRALENFAGKLTRVEIHLSDVNSAKPGLDDKRCVLEMRPAGRQPLAVTHSAATIDSAVKGALNKARNALRRLVGKESSPRTRAQRSAGVPRSPRAGKRKTVSSKRSRPDKKVSETPLAQGVTSKKSVRAKKSSTAKKAPALGRVPKKKSIHQARRKSRPKP